MTRFRSYPTVAAWTAVALMASGFVAIAASWRGAAGTASLALQLPFLLSGGFVGLGLLVFGAALAQIELTRRLASEEDAAIRDIVDTSARIAIALRDTPPVPAPRRPRPRRRRTPSPS